MESFILVDNNHQTSVIEIIPENCKPERSNQGRCYREHCTDGITVITQNQANSVEADDKDKLQKKQTRSVQVANHHTVSAGSENKHKTNGDDDVAVKIDSDDGNNIKPSRTTLKRKPEKAKRQPRQKSPGTSIKRKKSGEGFPCEICGITLTTKQSKTQHLTIHSGELLYECSLCSRKFRLKAYLKSHMNSHTGHKPHQCVECGRAFADPSNLNNHRLAVHSQNTPYACSICAKKFKRKNRWKEHLQKHLEDSDQEIRASVSRKAPYKSRVKNRQKSKCPKCGKILSDRASLQRHLLCHSGKRPYQCFYCNKTFRDHSDRNKHHRLHTNINPYECKSCGKQFKQSTTLTHHISVHHT